VNFDSLMLHDATILNIDFKWSNSLVVINVKSHAKNISLEFTGCTNISVPHENPWGKSSSINSTKYEDGLFKIEMQSGDVIAITANSFSMV